MSQIFPEAQRPFFRYAVSVTVELRTMDIEQKLGAGVIFSTAGHILTALHLVEGGGPIYVQRLSLTKTGWNVVKVSHGKQIADVVITDKKSDLAILCLRSVPANLPVATLGKSRSLKKKSPVFRVGRNSDHPLGNGHILDFTKEHTMPEIEISMPGDAGSSGGPVFDKKGRVIGMALRGDDENDLPYLTYAIPIDVVKSGILWKWLADYTQILSTNNPKF